MRTGSLLLLALSASAFAQFSPPRIPQSPDISGDNIAFESEGDIWVGNLSTGRASRLTNWPGPESQPRFSPDGTRVAFNGTYDGRTDVYAMSIDGGVPERLTYDPTGAEFMEWMPDGKSFLFRSSRLAGDLQLYSGTLDSKFPQALPMPMAAQASVNSTGDWVAYVRINLENHWWKRYRGGMANDIFLYDRKNSTFSQLTKHEINEQYPVFVGDRLFFVSEREGTANLYEYDFRSKSDRAVTKHTVYDVVAPASDGKRIIYRLGSDLFVWTPGGGAPERVKMQVSGDRVHAKPYTTPGVPGGFSVGPTGTRILVESRGQVFSAPVENGDIRAVASWPGVRNRLSSWSPDGKTVAFVSDKSDEQNVWTMNLSTGSATQLTRFAKIGLESLQWSPDGKSMLVWDASSTLWHVSVATGTATKVATDMNYAPVSSDISPDGRLIAYVKSDDFNQSSVWIYDVQAQTHHRVSRAPHRDSNPVFDKSGKYLYFLGDRSVSLNWDAFDFQMNADPPGRILMTSLVAGAVNPFAEKIDEEGSVAEKPEEKPAAALVYDLDGAAERVEFIPGPVGGLRALAAGNGRIWWLDGATLFSWDARRKRAEPVGEGVRAFQLTANGDKIASWTSAGISVGPVDNPLPGRVVNLLSWRVPVEPQAEWRQILRDGWRHIRDTFYDPNLHGADWNKVWADVSAQLPAVADREDLNDLIGQMQASVNVSHMFQGGGTNRFSAPEGSSGFGMLGCNFAYQNGGLQITRLFRGDGFEEGTRSPLLAAPANAKEGDYIVEIDGVPMREGKDPLTVLVGKARQLVRVKLNSKPSSDGAREVWIRAMGSETRARYFDWQNWNREYIAKNGGADFAYIHLPDMGQDGMAELTKHLYANLKKDGLLLDVRYNGGGITSGMVLERLRRVIFEYDQARYGNAIPYHRMGFASRVVILTNEFTGSDGEYFSFGFRMMKLGPSVGKRTWGGYAAVSGMQTIDGGSISCPVQGSYPPDGNWLPDGYGFKPDVEVDIDPKSAIAGRDPQLDRAIAMLREELRKNPVKRPGRQTPPVKLP